MQLREFLERLFQVALEKGTETFGPPDSISTENMKRQFFSAYIPAARKELYDRLVTKNLPSYTPERLISDALEYIRGAGLIIQMFSLNSGSVNKENALSVLGAILTSFLYEGVLNGPYHGNLLQDITLVQTQLGVHESRQTPIHKDEEAKLRHDLANSLLDARPIIHFLKENQWPEAQAGGQYL